MAARVVFSAGRAAAPSASRTLQRRWQSTAPEYQLIKVTSPAPAVTLVTLNRPPMNPLSSKVMAELSTALRAADADQSVRAIVLTGNARAFAAGADIHEMVDLSYAEAYRSDFLGGWRDIRSVRKPLIGAVSGYALGGGCELAMMCDILLASPTAVFGQPEMNLGVIPGMGGSQYTTLALGKSRAMEMILTGGNMTAKEAEHFGLVSRVVGEGEDEVVKEAIRVAEKIAKKGALAVQAGKEAVLATYEFPLSEGIRFERRLFQGLFNTADKKEGMSAFVEKRKAKFTHS